MSNSLGLIEKDQIIWVKLKVDNTHEALTLLALSLSMADTQIHGCEVQEVWLDNDKFEQTRKLVDNMTTIKQTISDLNSVLQEI